MSLWVYCFFGYVLSEMFSDDDGDSFLWVVVFSACGIRHVVCVRVEFAVGQVELASLLEKYDVEVFGGCGKYLALVLEVTIDVEGDDFQLRRVACVG